MTTAIWQHSFSSVNFLVLKNVCHVANNKCVYRVCCPRGVKYMSVCHKGSILGPVLFSIYMNDLPNCVQICKLNLYADDMEMQCSNVNFLCRT